MYYFRRWGYAQVSQSDIETDFTDAPKFRSVPTSRPRKVVIASIIVLLCFAMSFMAHRERHETRSLNDDSHAHDNQETSGHETPVHQEEEIVVDQLAQQLGGCAEEIGGLKARLSMLNETKAEIDLMFEDEKADKTLKIAEMEGLSRQLADANMEIDQLQGDLNDLHEVKVKLEENLVREIENKTDREKRVQILEEQIQTEEKEIKVIQEEVKVLKEMLADSDEQNKSKSEDIFELQEELDMIRQDLEQMTLEKQGADAKLEEQADHRQITIARQETTKSPTRGHVNLNSDSAQQPIIQTSKRSRIVHVLAPYPSEKDNPSYQFYAQPVALASLARARKFALSRGINVEFVIFGRTADFDYASAFIPNATLAKQTRCGSDPLDMLDIPCLPLVKDILLAAYEKSTAPHVVYTNADIGLYENFYVQIAKMLKEYPSFSVERRNIPKHPDSGKHYTIHDLDEVYKLPSITRKHSGGDCFAWRKDLFSPQDLDLRQMIVGTAYWDGIFKLILQQKKKGNVIYYRDESKSLTWHQGTDQGWQVTTPANSRRNCWNLLTGSTILFDHVEYSEAAPRQYGLMTNSLCRFGRYFQCRNFGALLDHFYPTLEPRRALENTCLFKSPKSVCNGPKLWKENPRPFFGNIPCRGDCLNEEPLKDFTSAWKLCTVTEDCHIVMRDPESKFHLRRFGFPYVESPSTNERYSFVYYDCDPKLWSKILPGKFEETGTFELNFSGNLNTSGLQ